MKARAEKKVPPSFALEIASNSKYQTLSHATNSEKLLVVTRER
jgi:hypothetical protein